MGTVWDAPNQQVVRPDQSPPWEEGTGGAPLPKEDESNPLDSMTKEQLVAYAAEQGYEIDPSTTKAEIKATIEAAGG